MVAQDLRGFEWGLRRPCQVHKRAVRSLSQCHKDLQAKRHKGNENQKKLT